MDNEHKEDDLKTLLKDSAYAFLILILFFIVCFFANRI